MKDAKLKTMPLQPAIEKDQSYLPYKYYTQIIRRGNDNIIAAIQMLFLFLDTTKLDRALADQTSAGLEPGCF